MIDKSELAIVTSPKAFTDKTFEKKNEEGLFSQRIFGPEKSYRCLCGHLSSRTQHKGQTCPKCHVQCTTNDVRYKRFAKIVLPLPIYKPTSSNKKLLTSIVWSRKYSAKYLLDPSQSDLSIRETNYLIYDSKRDVCKITDEYIPNICVPLRITGTYTLYLAILACWRFFGSPFAQNIIERCFDYNLLVTPPGTRPYMVQTKQGTRTYTTDDVNDYYTKILEHHQYDWTNVITDPQNLQETYLDMIQNTIGSELPIVDEDLKFYDEILCRYQYYTNKIYEHITKVLSGKHGYIRKDFLGRSIDFSSRSHIVVDPSLKAYEIKMPKNNFMRLWFIEYMRFLKIYKNIKIEGLLTIVKITESNTKIASSFPQYVDEFIEFIFSDETPPESRVVLINRQPTLFRYGIPSVQVVGVTNTDVIHVSPLLCEVMNSDFDGDTKAIYRPHDRAAQTELIEQASILNNVIYDQNTNFIQTLRIESVYASYLLLSTHIDPIFPLIKLNNLNEINIHNLSFDELFNISHGVELNGETVSFGVCLFNIWAGFKEIKIKNFTNPNDISKTIYKDSQNNYEYHERLASLMKTMFWYATVNPNNPLTLSLDEMVSLDVDEYKKLLTKLPRNPYIGQHIYKGLIERIYNHIPKDHFFQKLIGAKLGKVATQLARMIGSIGYIADDQNIISSDAVSDSILNGLDEDTFFRTAIGARKGLVDKANATPDSGYLERSLVVNLSPVEIGTHDCGTTLGLPIHIMSNLHGKSLINRYYWDGSVWRLFTEKDISLFIDKTLVFRSPITCNEPGFKICRKCFGEYPVKTPYVGILSGQYISERMTQLSMRTFHTSGSCNLKVDSDVVNFIYRNIRDIQNEDGISTIIFNAPIPNIIYDKFVQIEGYFDRPDDHTLRYQEIENAENEDVTKTIKEINQLLRTETKCPQSVIDVYHKYISKVLENGEIYSSFIEIVLCNMYLTKQNEVLRYALNKDVNAFDDISLKLSPRHLHKAISKLLGLLYEPNAGSINKYASLDNPLRTCADTVLERLWTGSF